MGKRGSPPGTPRKKNSGRKPGTPNKRTWDLIRTLEKGGFDPAAKLLALTLEAEQSYQKQKFGDNGPSYLATASKNCIELMKFVYPTRKAVDITSGGEKVFQNLSELLASVANETKPDPSDTK